MSENDNAGRKVKCPRCGNQWVYKGNSKYFADCPKCLKRIMFKKNRKAKATKEG